jgi:hypothetical protein
MVIALEGTQGSRTLAVGETIRAFLDEHPDLAHRPTQIAEALGVSIGSAKREAKAWRDARKLSLLGPVYLQNVHLVTRTTPETVYPGSPPPPWEDRGDHKVTRRVELPPDGHMELRWSANGTVEIVVASPLGLTASEVLQAIAFAKAILPLDVDAPGTLSFEALRDGSSLRLDGIEAVTLRTAESLLLKAYRHSDRRGEALRMEVRTPPMTYTLREAEAMLTDRRPLGRDSAIERLTLQVEDLSRASTWQKKEILHMRKALDELRGSGEVR